MISHFTIQLSIICFVRMYELERVDYGVTSLRNEPWFQLQPQVIDATDSQL